jgi:glycosyltransferase involved in cell wall biosynthesis
MLDGHEVVVVVPAFREAPRIGRVVKGMPSFVDRVIVVDDASHDGTADEARAVGDPRVEVVVHESNRGVGAAIVTGYRRALDVVSDPRAAFAVMAGDGQMHPDDLAPLVRSVVRDEADYAKGDRFAWTDGARAMPMQRRLGGRVFSWLTTHAIGVPVSDSQCGYTAIARDACAKLDLAALWPGYGYPNDLLSELALRSMRIVHVPVRAVYADEVSGLRLRHLGRIAWLCARAYARRLRASG